MVLLRLESRKNQQKTKTPTGVNLPKQNWRFLFQTSRCRTQFRKQYCNQIETNTNGFNMVKKVLTMLKRRFSHLNG